MYFYFRRDILVVTAKVLHNTLKQKEIDSIQKFSLIVFDECHHTQSDHPYNEIMHLYLDAKLNGVPVESLPQVDHNAARCLETLCLWLEHFFQFCLDQPQMGLDKSFYAQLFKIRLYARIIKRPHFSHDKRQSL